MNVDEALLIADGMPTPTDAKGALAAMLILADEVRRQHCAIEEAKRSLELVLQILEVASNG